MKLEVLEKPNLKRVKMTCDEIIDEKLTKYPMSEDLWSNTSFNIVLGKMGSGKTSLVTNLIKKVFKMCFHHMIVFMPTTSRQSIQNDIYGKYVPNQDLYDELTEDALDEVIMKLEENSANGEFTFLLIDDFQAALKNPIIINKLQKIVTCMRHLRTTIFILQQNFQKLAKFLREIVTNVITFNVGKSQLNKLFDEIVQLDKDKYQELIDLAFRNKNDWIAINVNGSRNIYRMFDKINYE